MLPVFPIRLLMLALPAVIAAGVLAYAGTRGAGVFKKQGVAWGLTALMVVAAIGIGLAKTSAGNTPEPDYQQGPGTFPSYVRDDAGVLSNGTERELYERNLRLYENHGVVIGAVTCNYGRDDLYDYALQRAEDMGLGGYDFIVVLDIRGDNYWLIQGYDLLPYFTDEDCSDYVYEYMERDFARGDYNAAVLNLTEALEDWCDDYFN